MCEDTSQSSAVSTSSDCQACCHLLPPELRLFVNNVIPCLPGSMGCPLLLPLYGQNYAADYAGAEAECKPMLPACWLHMSLQLHDVLCGAQVA